jgi:hypothetical protein
VRLSLLAARVGLSASSSFTAERLAVGVLPRAVRELEDMLGGGGALVWACEVELDEVIDDDEFLERAACGVGDVRWSMAGVVYLSRPTAASKRLVGHLLTWDLPL